VPSRPSPVRLLTVLVLALLASGCADGHGGEVPGSASDAVDCSGSPYRTGSGNYDSGPEDVRDDARGALDDWLEQEGWSLPDVEWAEAARQGDEALFTWSSAGSVLAAFVVRDGTDGLDDHRGWGVASYAVCDPADWPPDKSDEIGVEVWTNADGDRVPTSLIQSFRGPEHCGWEETTFLFLGKDGEDGLFYGTPDPDFDRFLRTTYAAHAEPPGDAADTGYRRDGRELWVTPDAAYLVAADGDAERWPAPEQPIYCD